MIKRTPHIVVALLLLLITFSCSQEKNTFINRAYHNVTAKFNGYYNAREKIREGQKKYKDGYEEDYKQLLPIFLYPSEDEASSLAPEMDAAIEKCSRVIEMHSMDIKGTEYCKWIDDSWFIIGQAHFYKHEFDKAKEIFEYMTKEYKRQPEKYRGLIWTAKCYMAKERWYDARRVLIELRNDRRIPEEYRVEYLLTEADFQIKQQNYEEAIPRVKDAIPLVRKKDEKTRLLYILAQLYQLEGDSYLSIGFFKEVIKRHPNYEMEFYAKINLATSFSGGGSSDEIIEILSDMLKDDKNIDYFDQIYYALAEIYLKQGDKDKAIEALTLSAKSSTTNTEQKGLSFYKLADLYFKDLEYQTAQKYFDSTTTYLSTEHPDYEYITKVSNSLNELVRNIQIIEREDSLQQLAQLPEDQLEDLLYDKIDQYEREQEEKARQKENEDFGNMGGAQYNSMPDEGNGKWYFYNPSAVDFGLSEFKRVWGNRKNEDNWRRSDKRSVAVFEDLTGSETESTSDSGRVTDPTDIEFYKQDIPFEPEQLEASNNRLKKAYYDLGLVYNQQLEDNEKAIESFESLVMKYDSSDYHLVTYYRLYRIFVQEDRPSKANYYKDLILNNYPESDYAKLIKNPNYLKEENSEKKEVEEYYKKTYGYYQREYYKACVMNCDESTQLYPDNHMKTKFLLLKAQATGKMGEREKCINLLNQLTAKHGSTEEGKEAAELLAYLKKAEERNKAKKEEEERLAKGYVYNPSSKHTAVLIVPDEKEDLEKVKIAISNFNGQYFKLANLSVSAIFLDKKNQMVSIKNFDDADAALKYYKAFKNNNSYLKSLNDKGYDLFVIDYENYPIFFSKKNVQEYLEFFSKHYLEEAQ